MGGLIHIYAGTGKGKTTASVGLCVRAAGRNQKVIFAQFLKTEDSGELVSLEKLGLEIIRSGLRLGFTNNMDEKTKTLCRAEQEGIMERIRERLSGEKVDLLVLDEVLDALNAGMLDEPAFCSFIANAAGRPDDPEIVLTGRNPAPWLVEMADYVSDVQKVKHPYDRGIKARIGIER
ncbi:MAG: cob(I)yrinic acid a,c-diamide adenosyltransferase [Spirochaetaceae bacterium]|jgi:cob(I)alamin adenosyltransferase|nr:cob(I)yrinic acid a,c-diamide adenosyltransferase [Spirochaetaceae bacterium]